MKTKEKAPIDVIPQKSPSFITCTQIWYIIVTLQSWLFVCRGHGGLVMRCSFTSRWSRNRCHLHRQPKSFRRTSRIGTHLLLRQSSVSILSPCVAVHINIIDKYCMIQVAYASFSHWYLDYNYYFPEMCVSILTHILEKDGNQTHQSSLMINYPIFL